MTPLAAIDRALARFGRRLFVKRLFRCGLAALAIHGSLVLLAAFLDRFLFLDDGVRRLLSAVALGLPVLIFVCLVVWLVATRPDRRTLAYLVEEAGGLDHGETIVTAEAVAREPAAATGAANPVRDELVAELVTAATAEAKGAARTARPRDPWLTTATLVTAAVAAVWGALAAWPACQFPLMLERAYAPWRDLPKPSFIRLKVAPDEIRIGRGEELVVQAEVEGELPWLVERLLKFAGNDTRRCFIEVAGQDPAEMTRVHRRLFLAARGDVREPLSFRVRCGDARTRLRAVEVVAQPEVAAVSLEITPPAYTGRPAETRSYPAQARATGAETLALLVGSQVAVEYRADQDLETAAVTVGGEPLAGATFDPASRTGRFAFEVTESVQITIDLVNRQGFRAVRPTVLAIEAVADRTPVVNLTAPAAESEQVPAALVPLAATVEDDLAIAAAAVVWQLNPQLDADAPLRELPLELPAPGRATLTLEAPLDLDATGAVPGDEIVAFVRVRDSAGNDGESAPFTIRVVSFTRGENERQRLAVLRWLATAAPTLAAGDAQPADDVVAQVREEAKRLGLGQEIEATRPAILDLLARETFLSETSRDKQDLIALHGLVAADAGLPAEAILGLTGRRRLENVIVRLYGMRREAERLAEAIAAGGAGAGIDRRAALGLETLEEIGGDLLDLARGLPAAGLDPDRLVELQAAANEAGYRMTRGSAAKRAAACGRVADAITTLIEAVRPAMPGLATLEAGTRARLTEAVAAVAATLARPADEAGRATAREWFWRRLELLDLDPFVAGGEILAALAAAGGGEPPAVPPAAAAAEREWWRWLAAEWEREQLAAAGEMAADERTVLAGLLAARLPAAAPAIPFAEAVAAVAAASPPLPDPKQAATAIRGAIGQLLGAEPADPVARAASVAAFDRAAELAVRSTAARSRIVQLAAGGSFADDAFLLRLRDALLRYRQNARLAATEAAGDPEGGRRPLAGLEAALGKLLVAAEAGELTDPAPVEKSPFLLGVRQSRALESAAAAGDRGILARDWPEANDLGLAAGLSLLGSVAASIEAAERALAAEPPDRDAWQRARSEIERGLAGFAALAAATAELAGPLADVQAKLAAVDRPTGDDAAAVRARRLALGDLRPAVAAVARRAAVVAERADADPGGFEGGPEQVQGEASRREALLGRRMVVDAWRSARRRAAAALLDGQADPAAVRGESLPWAAFAVRLGLSELGGAARAGGPQRTQEAKGDPLVAWLQREIDAARKAVRSPAGEGLYRQATLDYLDAVADLLRY
jgi:hypothetical protein